MMAGRPSPSYTVRGYSAPRAGAFSGRSRSLLARNSVLRQIDWVLVVVVGGLSAIGVLLVWSATQPSLLAAGQDPRTYLKKQLLWVVIGLIMMFAVSFADSSRLRSWTPLAYGVTLLGLVAVLTPLGSQINGAKAWISLPGGLQIEPSEFAKVALILGIATVFSQPRWGATPGLRSVLLALAVAAPLMALVVIEPALGVAMVLIVVTATMVVLSGTRLRILAGLVAVVAAVLALAGGTHLLKSYQLTRFTSFLHPSADLAGAGYNAAQAKIAVGSGGMFGDGLFHGQLVAGNFVPSQQTDFIFTVAGEELGFVGAISHRRPARHRGRPRAAHRRPCRRLVRHAGRLRRRRLVRVPVVREHRHDDRHHAHHRPTAAVRLLRRLGRIRRHDRYRHASVRPPPPQRLRVAGSAFE